MSQRLDSLGEVSLMNTGYLLPVSEYDIDAYNISFSNFLKNLNDIRSTGVDMSLSADQEANAITINKTTRRVGIGSFYGAESNHDALTPLYDLEIGGTSGNNPVFGLRGSGVVQDIVFDNNYCDYRFRKGVDDNFYISGSAADYPYMVFYSGSGLFISDAKAYNAVGLDPDVDLQLYGNEKIRVSVNDLTNENDIDFTYSGIQSSNDFYVDYNSGANATSGSFFGLSGSVFVSNVNQNTRIGNIDTFPDARLYVSNASTDGTSYKTLLLEDEVYPNLYFKQEDSSVDASITFNATDSLHFGRNKSTSTVASSDPFIFNLSNKRIGIGGINPSYILDITGGLSTMQKIATSDANLIVKYQSDYPVSSGPVENIFTTYSSGANNNFIIGYDFQNEYFFYQTGDTDNTYYTARNTHKFSKDGDVDIVGSYSTNNDYCYGKFIQCYHARCSSNDIYINPFHESSYTSPNTSNSTENPFVIAAFSGTIKKIQLLSADHDLSAFSNGGRFEIAVANAASGIDGELSSFSAPAASAPTVLPDNGVVAQFDLSQASGPGVIHTFTNFSGDPSFGAGQVLQYRIIDNGGNAVSINTTIMSSVSYNIS
jgi:hypothetical protein